MDQRPLPQSRATGLPDRKCSADIIDRRAEYTEPKAAADQGEQYGRFYAVDILLVEVKFVSKTGHGNSPSGASPICETETMTALIWVN